MAISEITSPVDLCDEKGRLNPAAVGWSRQPVHRANLRGRGRCKRWEYWAITQRDLVFAVTVSDLDYAALHAVYLLDGTGDEVVESALVPLSRVDLPETSGGAPVHVQAKNLAIDLVPGEAGWTMHVGSARLQASFEISRPAGHESLGVVVPWSDTRFQYTVKENTLPAVGEVRVDGRTITFDDAYATLDFGRGKWPYSITWNWAAGSGIVDGRTIGVQLGGSWTDGTGSTENALCVDGQIHYIGDDLRWEYDTADWMRPWRITDPLGGRVDATLTPRHVRTDQMQLGVLANDTHQAFGTWSGWMTDDAGTRFSVDGIVGWAEEVRNRW